MPVWIAMDGKTAVVGSKPSGVKDNAGFALNVEHLDTGTRISIKNAFTDVLHLERAVAINANEAANQFFWETVSSPNSFSVYSADLNGGRVTYLGTLQGAPVDLSWDGLLLYEASNGLVVRYLPTAVETKLQNAFSGAIRPPQPDDPRH